MEAASTVVNIQAKVDREAVINKPDFFIVPEGGECVHLDRWCSSLTCSDAVRTAMIIEIAYRRTCRLCC
jgi:hypothetical protein